MRRALVPVIATVVTLVVYQWLVSPWVSSLRDDLSFLHAARMVEMQRQVQAAHTSVPPPAHKE